MNITIISGTNRKGSMSLKLSRKIQNMYDDLGASTTVVDLMVNNDTFRGVVSGVIRGARTVRINPTGEDTYEIVLEIDRSTISQLMQSATRSS